jgi:hypothetical protein
MQQLTLFSGNRSSVVIFSSLFWKPYDARFQDVLDSMKHHQKLLTTELSLYGHQTTHVNLAKETEDLKKELQGIRGVSKKQQDRCEQRCQQSSQSSRASLI